MKIAIFTGLYLFISTSCYPQNLIKNSSFEDSIPANFWTTVTGLCINIPLNICNKTGDGGVENHISFNSYEGSNCVYLSLFQCETKWSDYLIYKNLKMEKGKSYEISFFISPSDSCTYFAKYIDVVFSNFSLFSKNISCLTPGRITFTPTLSFDISLFKTTGQEGKWLKVSGVFTANGDEDAMVLGSFLRKEKPRQYFSTRIFDYKPNKKYLGEKFCSADYYVDGFSLIEKR